MKTHLAFNDFYKICLAELKSRQNYTEAYLPQLERFVMLTIKTEQVATEILKEDLVSTYTNRGKQKNKVVNPKIRIFFELNRECNALAGALCLSPYHNKGGASKAKVEKKFNLKAA